MRSTDTGPDAEAAYIFAYSSLSGADRVLRAIEMAEHAKAVEIAGIRFRHPELADDEVAAAWFRILHGDQLFDAVFCDAV